MSNFPKLSELVIDIIPRFLLTAGYSSSEKKGGWYYVARSYRNIRWMNEVKKDSERKGRCGGHHKDSNTTTNYVNMEVVSIQNEIFEKERLSKGIFSPLSP